MIGPGPVGPSTSDLVVWASETAVLLADQDHGAARERLSWIRAAGRAGFGVAVGQWIGTFVVFQTESELHGLGVVAMSPWSLWQGVDPMPMFHLLAGLVAAGDDDGFQAVFSQLPDPVTVAVGGMSLQVASQIVEARRAATAGVPVSVPRIDRNAVGLFDASCPCGWTGEDFPTPAAALEQLAAHTSLQPESDAS